MAAAAQSNPAALAQAIQAGVNPQQAQKTFARSQYLAQVLQQLQAQGGQNIRSAPQLGLNLLAEVIAARGKRNADAEQAQIMRQVAQAQFPNDPKAQFLYLTNPGALTDNMAKQYAPINARQGDTVLNAGPSGAYTAPIFGHDAGYFFQQGPQGVAIQGQRPMSYGESLDVGRNTETARHNAAEEAIGRIQAEAAMIGAKNGSMNAATNAGQLGLGQANSAQFAAPPGFSERVR